MSTRDLSSRRPRVVVGMLLLLVAAVSLASTSAGTSPNGPERASPRLADNHFIGAKKCKTCHKSEAIGDQYGKWEKMKHAEAYDVLGTDAARELARKAEIEDPQQAPGCLKCHVTGYGEPEEAFARGFKAEMGVQCESCHGPGEAHMKARVAAVMDAGDGTVEPVAPGEIVSRPPVETCLGCHNEESPAFKPFCYREMKAKIQHLIPGKERSEEERAALTAACGCGEDCKCVHGADDARCTAEGTGK